MEIFKISKETYAIMYNLDRILQLLDTPYLKVVDIVAKYRMFVLH